MKETEVLLVPIKAKHVKKATSFTSNQNCNLGNALKDIAEGPISAGVQQSYVKGAHYSHKPYTSKNFNFDKLRAFFSRDERVLRVLELRKN